MLLLLIVAALPACSDKDDGKEEMVVTGAFTNATYTAGSKEGSGAFSIYTGESYVIYLFNAGNKDEYFVQLNDATATTENGVTSVTAPSAQTSHFKAGKDNGTAQVSNIVFSYWEKEKRAALKLDIDGVTYYYKGDLDDNAQPNAWQQSRYVDVKVLEGTGKKMEYVETEGTRVTTRVVDASLGKMEDGTPLLYYTYRYKNKTATGDSIEFMKEVFVKVPDAVVQQTSAGTYTFTTDTINRSVFYFNGGGSTGGGEKDYADIKLVLDTTTKQMHISFGPMKGRIKTVITGSWDSSATPLREEKSQYKKVN